MLIHTFSDPITVEAPERRMLLGGKGAGLATMTAELGLAVPPGFVITTDAFHAFHREGSLDFLVDELRVAVDRLEVAVGRELGDGDQPLVVSVRSGAPVSMPGMMDTILNLGLTDETTRGLAALTNAPFANECRERFDKMFSEIVLAAHDDGTSPGVPADAWTQLLLAIEAVFRSWDSSRAIEYRRVEAIPDDLGTAVTVQAMVFGNSGPDSGTGVVFTRDPSTGEHVLFGDYLSDAQGEDVVAGTHQTVPLTQMETVVPGAYAELLEVLDGLERHTADICDVEFTVENGKLWILQSRVGKRTPLAAVEVAVAMATDPDFPLSLAGAIGCVTGGQLDTVLSATHAVTTAEPIAGGLGASPGLATGQAYFSADDAVDAVDAADQGVAVVLVRPETSPADVHGMGVAQGILTSTGGLASHAAVVARGWGIPAVVGVGEGLAVFERHAVAGAHTINEGDVITIDGTSGDVFRDVVDLHESDIAPATETFLAWVDDTLRDLDPGREVDGAPRERLEAAQMLLAESADIAVVG
jgi:pyruvate,orthophosphate dikinase